MGLKGLRRLAVRAGLWVAGGMAACIGVSLVVVWAGGCGPSLFYVPSIAAGQLEAILRSEPIEAVLERGDRPEVELEKIRLIIDARRYGIDRIGLTEGRSFTTFLDVEKTSKAYNVSASAKDAFDEVTWSFPFVGTVPYLIFFSQPSAEAQVKQLERRGLDVFMYEVDAYSTANTIPNPVRSSMLRRNEVFIVDTVMHEMLHDTIWRASDVEFNESLATFVGRSAAMQFIQERFPDRQELIDAATALYADIDRYNAFVFDLYGRLEAFYASDLADEAKVAGRDAVFQAARDRFAQEIQPELNFPEGFDWVKNLPANNAWMLSNYRYNLDLNLFERVHEATGNDWPATLDVFREAVAADDAKAFLRQWLAARAADESAG